MIRQVVALEIVAVIVMFSIVNDQATAQEISAGGMIWDLETGLSKTVAGYPNVAGDDWTGYFYKTDSSRRTRITAVITHDGDGKIIVKTSLSGLGHKLEGYVSRGYGGLVYLVEKCCGSNVGEEWTTHDLKESTAAYFGFTDYVDTTYQALYRIELTRDPPPPPPFWLSSVLQLLLLN